MTEVTISIPQSLVGTCINRLNNLNQNVLAGALQDHWQNVDEPGTPVADEQAAAMAEKYPAYWRTLPKHWLAVDTYRVNRLFPVDDPSGQLLHARKKLLVPGCRTGGKSVYDDIKEAHATLGAWLADNKPE